MRKHWRKAILQVCLAFVMLTALRGGSRADQFWIEPQRANSTQSDWYARGIERRTGSVVRFDSDRFQYQPSGSDDEVLIASARVIWIDPQPITESEREAMRYLADGDYSASLQKLPEILRAKPPVWRQQWITMTAAVAAWKSGRPDISLELVSQLDQRPLPPIAIAWLPIAWTNRPQDANVIRAATSRLADASPAARLVSASWLLSSPKRSDAMLALKQLEAQDRKGIAKLARILSWRAATPPEVLQSHKQWESAIDSLPMVWQTGPLTLLVDKLQAANQNEAANRLRWSLELTPIQPHYEWMRAPSDQRPARDSDLPR